MQNSVTTRAVAVYSTMRVLREIRERAGDAHMLAFMERYLAKVDEIAPEIGEAFEAELVSRQISELCEPLEVR